MKAHSAWWFLALILLAGVAAVVLPLISPMHAATAAPAPEQAYMMRAIDHDKAKYGGVLRLAAHGPPAHFDWNATTTIANVGSQAPMYNGLLRRDPRDSSLPIIGDLAYKWEISPDATVYTFHLRKGVKFHDGAELTADDVKASYTRIIFPPRGLVSVRQGAFEAVKEINVIDPYTIQFKLRGPRSSSLMLELFASGWNMIVRKKTLEEHNYDLRKVDNAPGTGPFRYVSRDDIKWVQERNPNYWNPSVPYVDRIEHIWLKAWSPELAAATLGGKVDWAEWVDILSAKRVMAGEFPRIKAVKHTHTWGHMFALNNTRDPFNDRRVRRAFSLVLDEPNLVEATKEIRTYVRAGWYLPNTEYAISEKELAERPLYRHPTPEDIAEARRLLAEAGYPGGKGLRVFDLLSRETLDHKALAAAIQAMLKAGLGVETKIRIAEASVWFEDAAAGKFDIAFIGYGGGFTADPAALLLPQFKSVDGKPGAYNQVGFVSAEYDKLADRFVSEMNALKRRELARQIHDFLDREAPSIAVGSVQEYWLWWDHLRGMPPGDFTAGYDLHKWDQVWLAR